MRQIGRWMLGLAAVVAAGIATPASAQSWPTQRVTIVVPFGAGSVTDILARIFADEMGRRWNQQVIVENRPGLAGTAAVAKATPDGYTLMVTSNGHTVANLVSKDRAVRSGEGFCRHHAARLGAAFLISHPGRPAKTLKEIIDARQEGARQAQLLLARPRQHHVHRRCAVPPRRRHQHRPRAVQERAGRGDRGDPRRRAALFRAGQSGARPVAGRQGSRHRGGDREAHSGAAGHADLHRGRPEVRLRLLVRPDDAKAAVPQAIRDKINKDWADAIKTPEIQNKLKAQFLIGVTDTPAAMDKIVRDETAQLTETFKAAGIGTQ